MPAHFAGQYGQEFIAAGGFVVVVLFAREDVHGPTGRPSIDAGLDVLVLAGEHELVTPTNRIQTKVCGEPEAVAYVLTCERVGRREEGNHPSP